MSTIECRNQKKKHIVSLTLSTKDRPAVLAGNQPFGTTLIGT